MVTTSADSGTGSFRSAIISANNNPGKDTIKFDFTSPQFTKVITPGVIAIDVGGETLNVGTPQSVAVIRPTSSALPTISEAVIIDGTLAGFGLTGRVPGVELRGDALSGSPAGLRLDNADGSEIYGLIVNSFVIGINVLRTDGASIEDCYIGVSVSGAAVLNASNIVLQIGSANNELRNNLIADAGGYGIEIRDEFSTGNVLTGNVIAGNSAGVGIRNAANNAIGSTSFGLGNVIANNDWGIEILQDAGGAGVATNNGVFNNRIRSNNIGVWIKEAANNFVGGSSSGAANVITANIEGVVIEGTQATNNIVRGNFVGMFADGSTVDGRGKTTGNQAAGIRVWDAPRNTVRDNFVGATNSGPNFLSEFQRLGLPLVSYVPAGIVIGEPGASSNNILNNRVGTTPDGLVAAPNFGHGVLITFAPQNVVTGNTIAGTQKIPFGGGFVGGTGSGITVEGQTATGNTLTKNRVGVNVTGSVALGNAGNGIVVNAASGNTIGGVYPTTGNLISGNGESGVLLSQASGNVVQGNVIGANSSVTGALPNRFGVIMDGAPNNVIGGAAPDVWNIISGNLADGVSVLGEEATGNRIQGNRIGLDAVGVDKIPNGGWGLVIDDATGATIGGTDVWAGNVIGGNGAGGVVLSDASGIVIQGNLIGVGNLNIPAGNGGVGVFLNRSSNNVIGGATAGAGNSIGSNEAAGIVLNASSSNTIRGNAIGGGGVLIDRPNAGHGIAVVGGHDNVLGDLNAGNQIVGNNGSGISIEGAAATNTSISNNTIRQNLTHGIEITGAAQTRIGGAAATANVIQYNRGAGISINGPQTVVASNSIEGNAAGIVVVTSGNTIGGATPQLGNKIFDNRGPGVAVLIGVENAIVSNRIYRNEGLGIELAAIAPDGSQLFAGPNYNDALDADEGANHFLNHPIITSALNRSGGSRITGTLSTTPNTEALIQLFSSSFPDASGFGEGENFLGQTVITTNAAGLAEFSVDVTVALSPGVALAATATTMAGAVLRDTSEFSPAWRVPTLEFQVNLFPEGPQQSPAIAMDARGNYVVAWTGWDGVGSHPVVNSILYRRFDAAGTPLDETDLVAAPLAGGYLGELVAAMNSTGQFVLAWTGEDESLHGVYALRFDEAGYPLDEAPFQVNTITAKQQKGPSVAIDPDGDFVIAWESGYFVREEGGDGDRYGVYARRYNAAGAPQSTNEFLVNQTIAGNQWIPEVVMDQDGDFTVVWQSSDSPNSGTFGRRFSAAGVPQGGEFRINNEDGYNAWAPSVAMSPAGELIVAWDSYSIFSIYARRFAPDGQPIDAQPLKLTRDTYGFGGAPSFPDDNSRPSIALDSAGNFIVAWYRETRIAPSVYDLDVVYRRFNASGQPLGNEAVVHEFTVGPQNYPALAMTTSGLNYTIVWQSEGQDGDGAGIFGRSFGPVNYPPVALSDDLNAVEGEPLYLVLRGDDGNPERVQSIQFAIDQPPQFGTLALLSDYPGHFVYTPHNGFVGTDVFTFTVTDDDSAGTAARESSPGTVTIRVESVIDAVTASDVDNDQDVDGTEFLAWQQHQGTMNATQAQGDANADGRVNALDLTAWKHAFGHYLNADADGNGMAEGGDFLAWQRNAGSTNSSQPTGDFDGGGRVNSSDLNVWIRQFGSPAASSTEASNPNAAALSTIDKISVTALLPLSVGEFSRYGHKDLRPNDVQVADGRLTSAIHPQSTQPNVDMDAGRRVRILSAEGSQDPEEIVRNLDAAFESEVDWGLL